MKGRFKLTVRAQADLDAIADYTLEQWGAGQMERYVKALDARFVWLAERPEIGRRRDDILGALRCYPEGSHLIFYRIADVGIEIVGIPHRSMDIGSYFEE